MTTCRVTLARAALFLTTAVVQAQEPSAPEEQQFASVGIARGGATGLLTLASPAVPDPGTVAASLSYGATFQSGGTNSVLPAGLSFGFAKRMEAFATFAGYRMPGYPDETQSTFGMKANVLFLNDGAQELSLIASVHSLRIAGVDSAGDESATAYSAGLLFSTLLFGETMGYLEAGYAVTPDNLPEFSGRIIGGAGIRYPVLNLFLLGIEASTTSQLSRSSGYAGRAGAKFFLFDHLQVTVGTEGVHLNGTTAVGAFLGIGFSSATLSIGRGERIQPPELLPEPPPLEELSPGDSSSTPDGRPYGYRAPPGIHYEMAERHAASWQAHSTPQERTEGFSDKLQSRFPAPQKP